jgi:hypothetical protein
VAAPLGGPSRPASLPVLERSWFNGQALGVIGLSLAFVVVALRAAAMLSPVPAALGAGTRALPRQEIAPAPPGRVVRRRGIAVPGVPEALASGVGFGLFFVLLDRTGEAAGNWPLVVARGASVVMFATAALVTRGPLLPAPGTRRAVVAAGVLDAAAAVLFVAATRSGLLSISAVLSSMYPGVTVLLARVVTKERCTRVQLLGLALAGTAVGLLAVS